MLVVIIPALHVMNTRYVQRIALFIGASQMAYLAFIGRLDDRLSEMLVNNFNHAVSVSYNVIVHKILLFVA
jgi:hypothetical protein